MLRFRNPGTQLITQINVFKKLYLHLYNLPSFGIKEMADVIAQNNLLTAYGYAGDSALQLSNTMQESMNSARMNAKMYAEIFRMLGWISPASEKSYPVCFTIIGRHIALSQGYSEELVKQCILGINNPTELTAKISYTENVRFFKCALRFMIDMGGTVYKHELSLGPMSVNDENENEYTKMIADIKLMRGDFHKLQDAFSSLAKSLGMQETPVDNCTRIPVAFLKICGFATSIKNRTLYNKSLDCLKITEYGQNVYKKIAEMKDMRLNEFNSFESSIQLALIRISIFQMLERGGYDISSVNQQLLCDKDTCKHILNCKELLFSPCQTIKYGKIAEALGEDYSIHNNAVPTNSEEVIFATRTTSKLVKCVLDENTVVDMSLLSEENNDIEFINNIISLSQEGNTCAQIAAKLFNDSQSFTQHQFYPLITQLFRIIGFECHQSRPGDNGARWDAIIKDKTSSIPIEIKSPTEEMHISIKAMRQAVENKIILLSRQTLPSTIASSTLIVGYYLPNDRAEVSNLIADYKNTYNIKIGIIDCKTLLLAAISVIVDNKCFEKSNIFALEGMLNVEI